MLQIFKRSQGSIILRVKIRDSSKTNGGGLTGLTSASSNLIISTIADNESTATAYTQAGSNIESIATLGTFAAPTSNKCRFKEVDSVNHPGLYEIQIVDTRFAVPNAKSLLVSISGATNLVETDAIIPLWAIDPYTSSIDSVGTVSGNVTGSVASVVGNVGGNIVGTVASVVGAVGSVTGNIGGTVASVVGAVGSVTGNVGGTVASVIGAVGSVSGNVGGSVGSVVGSVGSVAGNVSGSVASVVGGIGGNVTGSVASVVGNVGGNVVGTVASVVGAVGSVTGNVGGNVVGTVASVVGAVGSVTGNIGGNVVGAVGSVTGNIGGNVVGNVNGNVVGTVASVVGNVDGTVASVVGNIGGNVVGNVNGSVTSVIDPVAIQNGILKNIDFNNFEFPMFDSSDGVTLKSGLTVTALRSIDGNTFASCTNLVSEIGSTGIYKIDLDSTDLNGSIIVLKFTAIGANAQVITILTS